MLSNTLREQLRKLRRHAARGKLYAEYPLGKNECGILTGYGIGDHLLVHAFAREIEATHALRVAVIAGRPQYRFLSALFEHRYSYAPWILDPGDALWAQDLRPGSFFYGHFPLMELPRMIGWRNFHLIDAYRCRFGLEEKAFPRLPKPPSTDEVSQSVQWLREKGLPPGRTLIIATAARSIRTDEICSEFWNSVVDIAVANGLKPVLYAEPLSSVSLPVEAIDFTLAEFRAVAMAAGFFCGVRSGLCDLICNVPCRKVIIYPKTTFYRGSVIQGTTFNEYGLSDNILEIVVSKSDWRDALAPLAFALS
jgi:hypothetical protein